MAEILEGEFGVPVRWREELSRDTADNARFSAVMLKAAGISRIVLVTQAFHMPRAVALFEAAGLQVVAAPPASGLASTGRPNGSISFPAPAPCTTPITRCMNGWASPGCGWWRLWRSRVSRPAVRVRILIFTWGSI